MESEITVHADTADRLRGLWKEVEASRDQAVAHAGHAARSAVELGQILAELRSDWGQRQWEGWLGKNTPEIPLPKATRLANIAPKYRDLDKLQLEFKTVKELYQATDIMPPAEPAGHKTKTVDMNWSKLVQKLEVMVPTLNDGQKEMLRRALVKIVEGL